MKAFWKVLNDYGYPQPYKQVLILYDNNRISTGYYQGEMNRYPWFIENIGAYKESKYIKAWVELPNIPDEL